MNKEMLKLKKSAITSFCNKLFDTKILLKRKCETYCNIYKIFDTTKIQEITYLFDYFQKRIWQFAYLKFERVTQFYTYLQDEIKDIMKRFLVYLNKYILICTEAGLTDIKKELYSIKTALFERYHCGFLYFTLYEFHKNHANWR